jgi:aquaporin Z
MKNKCTAEFLGTLWLVLGGCGAAVLAGSGIGTLGISFAFGLSVLTMAYAIGPISGCHLNPAVTLGLVAANRFSMKDAVWHILSQILGGIAGAGILYLIASGKMGFDLSTGFAANGYGDHSPGGYSMGAAFICELVMTFFFLIVILHSTNKKAAPGFAPLSIGLCLTLIHLISIPVTNTSVNPARSISQAVFVQGWAFEQLWLFIAAPIAGAIIAGLFYRTMTDQNS